MRIFLCCAAAAVLAGCSSVVPPAAWTFDPTRPAPRSAPPAAELAALTNRTAGLQLERNDIRGRIAAEGDARNRQPLYERLHAVGMALSPLERRLAAIGAGR